MGKAVKQTCSHKQLSHLETVLAHERDILLREALLYGQEMAHATWRERVVLELALQQQQVADVLQVHLCQSEMPANSRCMPPPHPHTQQQHMLQEQLQPQQQHHHHHHQQLLQLLQPAPCDEVPLAASTSSISYVYSLLQAATGAQVQFVLRCTAADFVTYMGHCCTRLRQLLQQISAGSEQAVAPVLLQGAAAAAAAEVASTSTLQGHQAAVTPKHESCSSQTCSSCLSSYATAGSCYWKCNAAPAARSNSSSSTSMITHASDLLQAGVSSGSEQAIQELEQLVDEAVTVTALALLHNPTAWLQAAATELRSGQLGSAQQQHWQSVVQQLQLSDQQVLQLSVGAQEFSRLGRAASAEGAMLVHAMSQAAAELERWAGLTTPQGAPPPASPPAAELHSRATLPAPCAAEEHACSHDSCVADAAAAESNTSTVDAYSAAQHCAKAGTLLLQASARANAPLAAATAAVEQYTGSTSSSCSMSLQAAAAAAAEAGTGNGLGSARGLQQLQLQLQQYVSKQQRLLQLTSFFVMNTLQSKLQMAVLMVMSYPYLPEFGAVAEAAAAMQPQWQQQQQTEDSAVGDDVFSKFHSHDAAVSPAASAATAPVDAAANSSGSSFLARLHPSLQQQVQPQQLLREQQLIQQQRSWQQEVHHLLLACKHGSSTQ